VNYWKLFNQLLDDGVAVGLVQLSAYWYFHQEVTVVWLNTRSTPFAISNGIKQEGVLSAYLFTRCIRYLLCDISGTHIGCIGGLTVNIIAYSLLYLHLLGIYCRC